MKLNFKHKLKLTSNYILLMMKLLIWFKILPILLVLKYLV
jgi:hypothetical protein